MGALVFCLAWQTYLCDEGILRWPMKTYFHRTPFGDELYLITIGYYIGVDTDKHPIGHISSQSERSTVASEDEPLHVVLC